MSGNVNTVIPAMLKGSAASVIPISVWSLRSHVLMDVENIQESRTNLLWYSRTSKGE